MCNIFSKISKTDKELIAELKSNYEELLSYVKCLKLSDLQDVSGCLQPNLGDVLTYTGRIWNSLQSGVDIKNTPVQKITYAQLYNLYENKQLIPGQFYEITDYVTKCSGSVNGILISSAEHPFNIIVQATSNSTLNHNAKATPREGNTYFTYPALEAMEIKYDIDEGDWPYSDGKGWIYYMKDQQGNEANYDFKNILFTKDGVTSYTFNLQFDLDLPQDYSNFAHCTNNKIESETPSIIKYISFLVDVEHYDVFNNSIINSENIIIKGPARFNTLIQCHDLEVSGSNNNLTRTSGIVHGNSDILKGNWNIPQDSDSFEGFSPSQFIFYNESGEIPVLRFNVFPKGLGLLESVKVKYLVDTYDEIGYSEKVFTDVNFYETKTLSIPMNIDIEELDNYYSSNWETITIEIEAVDEYHRQLNLSLEYNK